MSNKKILFAISAIALLTMSACSRQSASSSKNESSSAEVSSEVSSSSVASSQSSQSSKVDEFLESIKDAPVETDVDIIDEITIVNADDGVYGNVYLPERVGDAKISWWSSNERVIYPHGYNDVKAGEVERQASDTTVNLKAKIEKDGVVTKYEQDVLVKAAPEEIADEDYEAYLFGHFIGEGTGETKDGVKIATGEQIFFALADVGQGLHFKDMNGSTSNNLKPVLTSDVGERGVRDPYMCRSPEGDTFYLIATDLSVYTRGGWNDNAGQATKTGSHSIILWESHDLVNWTHARQIPVAREDAGMAWAPEMTFCEETGEYYIFFSSTVLDDYELGRNAKILERDCVYYTTTRDFKHFSETKKFISNIKYPDDYTNTQETDQYAINNDYRKVIDGSVMKIGDYYYSACKDGGNNENHGGIRIQRAESLLPEDQLRPDGEYEEAVQWEFVQNLADVGFQAQGRNADNKCLEGPEWFVYNVADREDPNVPEIGLMADFYANTSVGYIPWATTDVEDINNENGSWRILESGENKDFSWDKQTKRHGTILRITAEEAERLKEAYPIA